MVFNIDDFIKYAKAGGSKVHIVEVHNAEADCAGCEQEDHQEQNHDTQSSLCFEDKEAIKKAVLTAVVNNPLCDPESLAYRLCQAVECINRYDEPRCSGGISS